MNEPGRVDCRLCQRRCSLLEGEVGFCGVRANRGGLLRCLTYGYPLFARIDPVEKKPLFHFFPGSRLLSLGGFGCNLRCSFCQNWYFSCLSSEEIGSYLQAHPPPHLSPSDVVRAARDKGCMGMAWTYNEPILWAEYILDVAKLARPLGLKTVVVTNGLLTPEALEMIGPYTDALRVDIKSLEAGFYESLTGFVPDLSGMLEVIRDARTKWGCHLEVVTPLIPEHGDDDLSLRQIGRWILSTLGPDTPWHLTRFYPAYRLKDLPPTRIESMGRAREIGLEEGLYFVYGTFPAAGGWGNTSCPACGEVAVKRSPSVVIQYDVEGRCPTCGFRLNIRNS